MKITRQLIETHAYKYCHMQETKYVSIFMYMGIGAITK